MKIIGAGAGRTGTTSLQAALEALGFGPAYHMNVVLRHPKHARTWLRAAQGEPIDWEKFLGSYEATLDYPAAPFYKDLMAVYPDARVLLSVRDPARWYESVRETIYLGGGVPEWMGLVYAPFRDLRAMINLLVWDGLFQGRFEDRDFAISRFEAWTAEVISNVPAEKLLVFDVKEGWEPLCAFLRVPVPNVPFPHLNDRARTQRIFAALRLVRQWGIVVVLGMLGLVVWFAARTILR